MADSNLTKRVLALGLKKLVASQPFEKVSVSDICDVCGVSRKTFYYHFKDKYDLAEWMFNTEFIAVLQKPETEDRWLFAGAICRYFYQERDFYRALLMFDGQNSFREYFQKFLSQALEPFLRPDMDEVEVAASYEGIAPEDVKDFYAHFVSDAVLLAIFRWLTGGAKLPPEQFVALLKGAAELIVVQSVKELKSRRGGEGAAAPETDG